MLKSKIHKILYLSKNFGFFIPGHRQKLKTQAKKTVSGKKIEPKSAIFLLC